jgi:hypothetical protein
LLREIPGKNAVRLQPGHKNHGVRKKKKWTRRGAQKNKDRGQKTPLQVFSSQVKETTTTTRSG